MARLRFRICILLLVLITPSRGVSQFAHNTATIIGIVLTEENNQRVEQAMVRLCDGGGNLIGQANTTEDGEFSFRGLERGPYILTFEANGFEKAEIHLDLSLASDRGMTVYLKRAVKESSAARAGPSVSAHELSMPEAARNLVASGEKKLYVDKNPEAGLKDFQHAVAVAPGYYEAYREIAMAYLTMGKRDEAQENFRKSIEVSQDTYGDADVGLGTLLVEKGDVGAGEKAIRRGVELNPNFWMGFYELGKLDLHRDRLDLALISAERARTLAPSTPIVYRLLANIHMRQKNDAALLGDLDAYIRLDPDSPAGLRAVQMREQIAQEVAKHNQPPPPESRPQ
jgi:tetratricopeptide (TPR) repeat protein